MDGLTERQKVVLEFIRSYVREHGYAPGHRDMTDGLDIKSTNGVRCHLKALARFGELS